MGFTGIEVYNLPKFEDMLAKFKSSSEDRMSTLKRSMDVKSRNRRK